MTDLFQEKKQNKVKIILARKYSLWVILLIAVAVFIVGWRIGSLPIGKDIIQGAKVSSKQNGGNIENKEELPEYLKKDVNFDLYWQVWNIINNNYYKKDVVQTRLFYGSLQGMVASLEDPYSVFFTPKGSQEFREELQGNFEGIGAEIGIKNNQLTVISPLPDSPAEKFGLRPNDLILEIDGQSTENMDLNEAVSKIRGQEGTEVILTIYREKTGELKNVEIIRGAINVRSVVWELIENNTIGYIKIRQFNGDTLNLFNDAVADIATKGVDRLILDLRSNPGGYLQTAVGVTGEWIGDNIAVSERDRDQNMTAHFAVGPARLADYDTVVLVNAGTASGSEIVAGALKDWNKATIVGTQTFGKGSVQDLTNLPDGSSIKLTIAKWFTPKGVSIEDEGITPDIEVDMTEEDYNADKDPQLERAVNLLKN